MAIRMMQFSAFYFVIGVLMGMGMSMAENYELTPVHVHLNLLGWVSMALGGILYHLFPQAAESRLGKWHFWLHVIGIPLMMVGLAVVILMGDAAEAFGIVIPVGGTLIVNGLGYLLIFGGTQRSLEIRS
ncbi:cytochrome-c oxidase [Cohnella sp. CFH 77786]|uniref:cytochrome-c oxidase n=1 Tax=Cohnella sp. CFH 77786 TaxID=2662265 RepID=UPI001C60C898|nr:cytochrome-c oxidase [Cohnella sp. CFH 77786]MBW5447332.1 cytochrome-c oxidase [Cohnella sp. CFH 77786]